MESVLCIPLLQPFATLTGFLYHQFRRTKALPCCRGVTHMRRHSSECPISSAGPKTIGLVSKSSFDISAGPPQLKAGREHN